MQRAGSKFSDAAERKLLNMWQGERSKKAENGWYEERCLPSGHWPGESGDRDGGDGEQIIGQAAHASHAPKQHSKDSTLPAHVNSWRVQLSSALEGEHVGIIRQTIRSGAHPALHLGLVG